MGEVKRGKQAVHRVFVDEIGQIPVASWSNLLKLQRHWPDTVFILAGDFQQHKPVRDFDAPKDYEHNVALHFLCNGRRMDLTTWRRGDFELGEICAKLRRFESIDPKLSCRVPTDVNIAATHETRKQVVQERMEAFLNHHGRWHVPVSEDRKIIGSQDVRLVAEMPVIAHENHHKLGMSNCMRATILKVTSSEMTVVIDDSGETITHPTAMFHQIWRLAFFYTSHQAQCRASPLKSLSQSMIVSIPNDRW